jgi:hypothetical protein
MKEIESGAEDYLTVCVAPDSVAARFSSHSAQKTSMIGKGTSNITTCSRRRRFRVPFDVFVWEQQTRGGRRRHREAAKRSRFPLCRYQITKQYRLIIIYSSLSLAWMNEALFCLLSGSFKTRPSRVSCSSMLDAARWEIFRPTHVWMKLN